MSTRWAFIIVCLLTLCTLVAVLPPTPKDTSPQPTVVHRMVTREITVTIGIRLVPVTR